MTAETLRAKTISELDTLGFKVAGSLPGPDMEVKLRDPEEITARLMALDALFSWVVFPEESASQVRVQNYLNRNGLRDWMTEDETQIISMSRSKAHKKNVDNIGWKLENMWSLAWALGFEPEPDLRASQIEEKVTRAIFYEFLPGLDGTIAAVASKATPRSREEVIALEYRFYCAHNAVRSAQLGRDTVPKGFHPILHGGAVHERRHSLTWCLSPETTWDETDLST